jgi:hypothetical protein
VGTAVGSFVSLLAVKLREAFQGKGAPLFTRWLEFFAYESGTITLFLVGIVTASLGRRLLTSVRLTDTRTIPVEDLPLVEDAVIQGKPEPVDQYVRLRSLSGWPGTFQKLGISGLPLTTVILTLIFSAISLLPLRGDQSKDFLDLAKLTLGAFIGSFVQRQVEQRSQEEAGSAPSPRPPLSA